MTARVENSNFSIVERGISPSSLASLWVIINKRRQGTGSLFSEELTPEHLPATYMDGHDDIRFSNGIMDIHIRPETGVGSQFGVKPGVEDIYHSSNGGVSVIRTWQGRSDGPAVPIGRYGVDTEPVSLLKRERNLTTQETSPEEKKNNAAQDNRISKDEATPRRISLIINDIDSRARVLTIEDELDNVNQLIAHISEWKSVPRNQLRCVFQNRELSDYRNFSLQEMGITHGQTIQLKLALKGGMNTTNPKKDDWVKTLNDIFRTQNRYVVNVKMDGNCLFRSIADQLEGTDTNYDAYRQLAVKYIQTNKDGDIRTYIEKEGDKDINIDAYIEKMSKDKTWGGEVELEALCRALNIEIWVHHDLPEKDNFIFRPAEHHEL